VAAIGDNANVIERIDYNPSGGAAVFDTTGNADVDGEGDHDTTDRNTINALTGSSGTPITSASYNVDCDRDRNGIINSTDYTLSSGSNAALAKGKLSAGGRQHLRLQRLRVQRQVCDLHRAPHAYDVTMSR
jgi:hypothetical protein